MSWADETSDDVPGMKKLVGVLSEKMISYIRGWAKRMKIYEIRGVEVGGDLIRERVKISYYNKYKWANTAMFTATSDGEVIQI